MSKLSERKARVFERLARKRAEREARRPATPPPRYDAVFWEGLAWLDKLAVAAVRVEPITRARADAARVGSTEQEVCGGVDREPDDGE